MAKLGYWDWNIPENAVFWSDEMYAITKRRPNDVSRNYVDFLDWVHPDDRSIVDEAFMQACSRDEFFVDFRLVLPNYECSTLHVTGEIHRDGSGIPIRVFGTCQDVSDRKRAADLLANFKQLVFAGQLAAELAHEIRNPLTTLKGFTQLLNEEGPQNDCNYFDIMIGELEQIESTLEEATCSGKTTCARNESKQYESSY